MSIEDLTKVQIYTASRHLEDSRQAPSDVTVITSEDIARYGWRTLGDVLSSVRGFYTSYDRDYSYLGVRGFLRPGDYNSRILLLIDGHRLNDNVYDSAPIGNEFPLNLDLIDHIEIVRGPGSSLFGTNAVFGVINVITRRPGSGNPVLEISGEQSSFVGRSGRMTSTFQQGPWSMLLSGNMLRSDGQPQLYFPAFSGQHGGLANDLDGEHVSQAFIDVERGELRFEGLYGTRTKLVPTAPYGMNFNDSPNSTTDSCGYFDLSDRHQFSNTTELETRAYYERYHFLGLGMYGGSDPATRSLLVATAQGDWIGAETTLDRQLGRNRLTLGTEYEYNMGLSQENYVSGQPSTLKINKSPWLAAPYGDLELNLIPKVTVHAGGRWDYFSESNGSFSPRIALVYFPNSRTVVKYVYGGAFRAPSAYESDYADGQSIEKPPIALHAEHISTNEIILERSLNSWMELTADGFYNHLTNLIDEAPDLATGLNYFKNSGHDRGRGAEIELSVAHSSGLRASASYTFSDVRDEILQAPLANSPAHLAKVKGTFPLTHQGFVGAELLYTGIQTSYMGDHIAASLLANLTLSTKPLWKNWEFSASCYNLFNRSWASPAGPDLIQHEIPQDGRTYRVKISYRLPMERLKRNP